MFTVVNSALLVPVLFRAHGIIVVADSGAIPHTPALAQRPGTGLAAEKTGSAACAERLAGCREQQRRAASVSENRGTLIHIGRRLGQMAEAGVDEIKAIANFTKVVGRFAQVALLTDEEVEELFGPETAAALVAFDRYSDVHGLCASCGGTCCSEIGCELYSPRFNQCPIHDTRPLLCRFHFCHRFDAVDKTLVIALRDIFLACYTADQISSGTIAKSMSVPPLETACPALVANVQPLMDAVQEGTLDPQEGIQLIRKDVERYRRHHSVAPE